MLLFFPIRVVAGSGGPGCSNGVLVADSWRCRCLSVDLRLKFLHPPASVICRRSAHVSSVVRGGPESDVFV